MLSPCEKLQDEPPLRIVIRMKDVWSRCLCPSRINSHFLRDSIYEYIDESYLDSKILSTAS